MNAPARVVLRGVYRWFRQLLKAKGDTSPLVIRGGIAVRNRAERSWGIDNNRQSVAPVYRGCLSIVSFLLMLDRQFLDKGTVVCLLWTNILHVCAIEKENNASCRRNEDVLYRKNSI